MRLDIHTAKREEAAAISRIYAASWRQAYRGMVPQHYLDELPDSHWTAALERWIDDPEVSGAAAELSAAGCEGGFLWVLRENLPARRFYESNGWSNDGATCTVELAGVPLTDLRYRQNWK